MSNTNAWQVVRKGNKNVNVVKEENNEESFPALHSLPNKTLAPKTAPQTAPGTFNFASALFKPQPKAESIEPSMKPGWVYISKGPGATDHQPTYAYAPLSEEYERNKNEEILKAEHCHDELLFKYFVKREQYYIDCENAQLGDLSPYWCEPPALHKYHAYINQEAYSNQ